MAKRSRPADPQAILERNAHRRALERQRDRDPANWGVAAEIVVLPTSRDLSVVRGARGRVIAARRSDAFGLLFQAGGLTGEQHAASQRYFRDWALRAGVREGSPADAGKVDHCASAELVTQGMIDAGGRIDEAHSFLGRADVALLRALVEPLTMRGEIRVWRELVRAVTGEAERHAQGARVRSACDNLAGAYDEVDRRKRRPTPR